jgi:DNA-binding transcriptional ArsR family regulator
MGEYSRINDTFAALADPTRRAIVRQLMHGPARVTELARPHEISLNSVSKHLRVLERANLVKRDVRGRDHWIAFDSKPLAEIRDWVTTTLGFWEARLDVLDELLREANRLEKKDGGT